MEAPLSSVLEHLSAPLCTIYIHRYMGRSTSAPLLLGLKHKTNNPHKLAHFSDHWSLARFAASSTFA